jgi:hypothetical protein
LLCITELLSQFSNEVHYEIIFVSQFPFTTLMALAKQSSWDFQPSQFPYTIIFSKLLYKRNLLIPQLLKVKKEKK